MINDVRKSHFTLAYLFNYGNVTITLIFAATALLSGLLRVLNLWLNFLILSCNYILEFQTCDNSGAFLSHAC